jgi:hypothetical protein
MTDVATQIAEHELRLKVLEESSKANALKLDAIIAQLAEIASALKYNHTPENCPKMSHVEDNLHALWRRIDDYGAQHAALLVRIAAIELRLAEASGSVKTGGGAIKYIAGAFGALLLAALSAWLGHIWK